MLKYGNLLLRSKKIDFFLLVLKTESRRPKKLVDSYVNLKILI